MQDKRLLEIKDFRQQLYSSVFYRKDACFDLLDALCSNTTATTPVMLSLNIHHRRTYNSITDVVSEFHKGEMTQYESIHSLLVSQIYNKNQGRDFYLFGLDCTSAPRAHSPTLTDRSIVYSPNPIAGNKPITIGHKFSTICFLPSKEHGEPPWVLPIDVSRVSSDNTEIEIGAAQLQKILRQVKQHNTKSLCINVVDSGYCKPDYIDAIHSKDDCNSNLVTIVRARSNRVVWRSAMEKHSRYGNKRGHELWYGTKFRFKNENTWHEPDDTLVETIITNKGKKLTVEIKSWQNMLTRQTKGIKMQEHPFTLLRIVVKNEQGKQVFHKPMWLMIYGERRNELSLWIIYQSYLQRYDIEHYFKFQKGHLLSDKLQSPETQHEENWWYICLLAYVLLFVVKDAVENNPYPWEKYLAEMKNKKRSASPAMVQRQFHQITKMIGTPARTPKPRGNPLGRATGQLMPPRIRHPVIIKSKIPILDAAA